jgi:hypothetical protein
MAKTQAAEAPEKKAKKEEPKIEYITTKHIADELGIKPATLRRYLRSLPMFQDEGYTRYKFDPNNKDDQRKLKDIKAGYAKFATEEKEKNKKRLEELKKAEKNGKGAAKGKGKKAAEEDEDEDTEEEEEELE